MNNEASISRRQFLQTGAALSATAALLPTSGVFAASSDTLRIALVGCGDRGTDAVKNCFDSGPGIELVAMGDVFKDKISSSLVNIRKSHGARVKVTPETCFTGFDAFKQVVAMKDVDVVLFATPPAFRPDHVRAAVEAGKHIFMEKPGAVDPVGVRSLMKSAEIADQKKLSIVVGTQQRWQAQYLEVLKRIHDGEMGKIVGGQAYWNWGYSDWHHNLRQPGWSDMEWQIRSWPYFVWLSGDHFVEQHLHNIDIINWAIGTHPIHCIGFGGRQQRTSPDYGNIYDHFTIEFEYPGGIRVMSMASQIKGSNIRVGERVVGSKGTSWTTREEAFIEGEKPYRYAGKVESGLVAEHANLIKSIRDGQPINEARRLAESTLTVIMGRLAAYTARRIEWDFAMNKSELDLRPAKLELGPLPVAPVAIPGQYDLI